MTALPSGWASCALKTIADVQLGRQRSPKNHNGPNMKPYLRAANVTWSGLALDDVKEMHFSPREAEAFRLRDGDILLSEASGSAREVGKPALWHGELAHCCFQNTLLRVRSPHVSAPYLLSFFKWLALSGQFARGSRGVGIHHLGAKALSEWSIPLAPRAEQDRIVAAIEEQFSRVDAGCVALESVAQKARRMRAATLSRLLSDSDGSAWPSTALGDVLISGRYGTSTKCSYDGDGMPVLRIPNVQSGSIDLTDLKFAADTRVDLTASAVAQDDILIIRTNGSRALIGRAAVVPAPPRPLAFASYLIQLRVNRELIDPQFLVATLGSPPARAEIEHLAATTAGQYNISLSKLRSLRVPIPPLRDQIAAIAEAQRQLSHATELEMTADRALRAATRLRTTILGSAFAGRLVSQDSTDEPAGLMLERLGNERAAGPSGTRGRRGKVVA